MEIIKSSKESMIGDGLDLIMFRITINCLKFSSRKLLSMKVPTFPTSPHPQFMVLAIMVSKGEEISTIGLFGQEVLPLKAIKTV